MGCANYTVTFNCVESESLNVVYIVLNAPFYSSANPVLTEGLAATIRQRWTNSDYTSPEFVRQIIMSSDGNPFFRKETGVESEDSIPAEGAIVTFGIVDDSFSFNTQKHSFKYLVSNTEYTSNDIDTLLPLLNTASPISSPVNGLHQATFEYTNPSDDDYLYLVWDLRYSQQVTLDYDASSASTACCSGVSGTYYLDGPNLIQATMIYDNASLITESADGFYNDGASEGGFYRELDTVSSVKTLLTRTKCDGCGPGPVLYDTFVGNTTQYNTISQACVNKDTTLTIYRAERSENVAGLNDVFYTTTALTPGTEYNGNNKWIPLKYANSLSADWYAVKIDGNGVVQQVSECVTIPLIGSVNIDLPLRTICATRSGSTGTTSQGVSGTLTVVGGDVVFFAQTFNQNYDSNIATGTLEITGIGTVSATTTGTQPVNSTSSLTVPPGTYQITLTAQIQVLAGSLKGMGCATISHNGKDLI